MHVLHIHTIFKNEAQASTQPLNHPPPSRGPLTRLLSASASPPNRPLPLGPPRRGSPLGRLPEGTEPENEKSVPPPWAFLRIWNWAYGSATICQVTMLKSCWRDLLFSISTPALPEKRKKPAATALWEIMCTSILSQRISWSVLSQGLNSIWSCLSCCTCLWWVIAPSTRASTITKAEFHMQQSNVTKFALRKRLSLGQLILPFWRSRTASPPLWPPLARVVPGAPVS